jgi:beta-glucosidase
VKHLAVNSIEDTRFDVDVVVGQRALREIYLPAFEQAVDVGVASIMSAYNSMNGAYCAENKPLLRDILKDEWGFRGFVESDWVWGMYSTVPSLEAGLDLEMPGPNWYGDKLLAAVQAGEADEALVDEAVTRVLRMKLCYGLDEPQPEPDETLRVTEEHVALAREVATRSSVLLRNEGAALPLDASSVSSVVVLGPLADVENIGDQGSSAVAPPEVVTVWEGLSEALGDKVAMYAELDDTSRAAAEAADAVILVVGLTSDEEGEGFIAAGDRTSLSLPAEQEAFINEVAALNDRTIAVLEGSSSIVTEAWIEEVDAVLEVWYPGMAGGHAVADLLLGVANPSGRLPVSFPRSMDDLPVFDNVNLEVSYDLWHGYRHLLREGTAVRFPFGFGLSYTTWQISAPQLAESAVAPGDVASVQATVTNTGDRDGIETVQVYASAPGAALERSPLWLVGFGQVEVAAGGEAQVQVSVPTERLAAWDESAGAWTYEPGSFELWVGSSVDDVASAGTLTVQ